MLREFIAVNQDEILQRCQASVAARSSSPPTQPKIDHGVPVFLNQLRETLRLGQLTSPEIGTSAIKHGHDLLRQGFTASQVVHAYGDVCQAITELAVELKAPISTGEFRTLNRCLDDAIAGAVTEYEPEHPPSGIDGECARGSEQFGFFVHELRNLLNTAIMAFELLATGDVGVGGSTGTVLHRSLLASRALVTRSVAEVRLTKGIQNLERFTVAALVEEIASASQLDANARGIRFIVAPVERSLVVAADRQVLAAVVGNLLHNAFKFTRPRTSVTLRAGASAERVLIEVQDECGGLPSGDVNDLFRPFEQRSADRTGIGLGLAFSRWGAEMNDGRIYARNLPGRGCVFTIDLPRQPVPAGVLIQS
jgi:signal transduction histidine kinase